jgi:hypothetical protein
MGGKGSGRLTDYTKEMGDQVCDAIATHDLGIYEICKLYPHLPGETTIYRWIYKIPEFYESYTRAKEAQAEVELETMKKLDEKARNSTYIDQFGNVRIDNAAVNLCRSQKDDIKWKLSKLKRKKYGDKMGDEEQKKSSPWIFKTNSKKNEDKK